MGMWDSVSEGYEVVGMRLPNGQIKVVKSSRGASGEVVSESVFMEKYGHVNEGTSTNYIILDSING